MPYQLNGTFIEACDCFELCPCWVDDEPDEGHCTGLVAWRITDGEIDGTPVAGRSVVAVTTHSGRRRTDGASTYLFVDDGATDEQLMVLTRAFTAEEAGALADLVQVTGRVVADPEQAPIAIENGGTTWSVRVGSADGAVVAVYGKELSFDGSPGPLTLDHTALHKELHISEKVTAQRSENLKLVIPALGGRGYLEATARSGMSGKFSYRSP